jgi:hypothetical protein
MKMFLTYVLHYKPKAESVHLHAGGVFASGLEEVRRSFFERGCSSEESIANGVGTVLKLYGYFEPPYGSAKSWERVAGALVYYFDEFPLAGGTMPPYRFPNGDFGIEYSFAEPLPIRHPQTGVPILYTGRSDQIVSWAGGVYIEDDKTTSQLGTTWAQQYEHRSQFTGYCWAAQRAGIDAVGVVVRGIAIRKTGYDSQEIVTYRAPWEIDRWFEQTCRDIQRMIKCWEENHWDYNLDHACTEFGGCTFAGQVCKSPEPQGWLDTHYTQKVWDPASHAEITPAEWLDRWRGKS